MNQLTFTFLFIKNLLLEKNNRKVKAISLSSCEISCGVHIVSVYCKHITYILYV